MNLSFGYEQVLMKINSDTQDLLNMLIDRFEVSANPCYLKMEEVNKSDFNLYTIHRTTIIHINTKKTRIEGSLVVAEIKAILNEVGEVMKINIHNCDYLIAMEVLFQKLSDLGYEVSRLKLNEESGFVLGIKSKDCNYLKVLS